MKVEVDQKKLIDSTKDLNYKRMMTKNPNRGFTSIIDHSYQNKIKLNSRKTSMSPYARRKSKN